MVAKPLYPLYKNIIKPLDRVRYPELRYILCKEMASYWRKKQKTDANVTSVIIVVAHVFLERKPMAGLFQNDFLLCWMT